MGWPSSPSSISGARLRLLVSESGDPSLPDGGDEGDGWRLSTSSSPSGGVVPMSSGASSGESRGGASLVPEESTILRVPIEVILSPLLRMSEC